METVARATAGVFTLGLSEGVMALGKNATKTPKPPEAPTTIKTDSTAVQQAVSEAAQRRARSRGYRSTILSQNFMAPDAAALKDTMGS